MAPSLCSEEKVCTVQGEKDQERTQLGRVLGAHKRKSSCCPGKPQARSQDTLALFPTHILTWGEPLSFHGGWWDE